MKKVTLNSGESVNVPEKGEIIKGHNTCYICKEKHNNHSKTDWAVITNPEIHPANGIFYRIQCLGCNENVIGQGKGMLLMMRNMETYENVGSKIDRDTNMELLQKAMAANESKTPSNNSGSGCMLVLILLIISISLTIL